MQLAQLAAAFLHDLETHFYVLLYPSETGGSASATTRAREQFYKFTGFLQVFKISFHGKPLNFSG